MHDPENPETAPDSLDGHLIVAPRPVGELVGRHMVDIAPGATLRAAIAKLVDADVGVIVIRDGETTKGILSERDLIDAVHEGTDLDEARVDHLMQPDIVSVDSATTVVDAARLMMDRGIRHLLVEGPDGGGIISMRATLRAMLDSRKATDR